MCTERAIYCVLRTLRAARLGPSATKSLSPQDDNAARDRSVSSCLETQGPSTSLGMTGWLSVSEQQMPGFQIGLHCRWRDADRSVRATRAKSFFRAFAGLD